jgi:putative membrane protein
MNKFLIRVVINAIAIAITAAVLPGIHVSDNGIVTLLIVAFIFGVVNAILKPVLAILTCPLIFLTLGLLLLVINGLLLLITDELAGGRFDVDGLGWAVLGGIIMGLVGLVLENALGVKDDDKKDKNKRPMVIEG